MFPSSGLNRFRTKDTPDFFFHLTIAFAVSSHSLAFHASKDITCLRDTNLSCWALARFRNNNHISQSPKVPGELRTRWRRLPGNREHPPFLVSLGWWSRSAPSCSSTHDWGGFFAYIHFLSHLGFQCHLVSCTGHWKMYQRTVNISGISPFSSRLSWYFRCNIIKWKSLNIKRKLKNDK